MKPLDIESALAGAKVWHDEHGAGRLVCADRNKLTNPLVVVFDNGEVETFTKDGRKWASAFQCLFMAPVKTKYAVVYCEHDGYVVIPHDSAEKRGWEIVSTFEVEE